MPRHDYRREGGQPRRRGQSRALRGGRSGIKIKGGSVATDGFRPIKVFVFEPKKEYEVKPKDFMAWLDRNCRSPRETMDRLKTRKILGVAKLR